MSGRTLGAATLAAITMAVLIPQPAQAAVTDCSIGRFCGWVNSDYTGARASFQYGSADLRNPIGGVVFDNRISSVVNFTNTGWCLYSGYNYSGYVGYIAPNGGGRLPTTSFDNTISSLRAQPSGGC